MRQKGAGMTLEEVIALGFDQSDDGGGVMSVGCSSCAAICVNGVPVHEAGCPNAMHECRGCDAMVPHGVRYCEDCR